MQRHVDGVLKTAEQALDRLIQLSLNAGRSVNRRDMQALRTVREFRRTRTAKRDASREARHERRTEPGAEG